MWPTEVIRLLEDEKKQQTDWEERLDFTSDLEAPLKVALVVEEGH